MSAVTDLLANPASTDIAFKWLEVLFPSGDSSVTGQAYGNAFSVFSSTLIFLASLFMGWQVMQGIVLSAYTGKILGERFHQIWAPLRVVLGFGLLVPLPDGFSGVHYILRDVVGKAAIQLGNAPIKAYVGTMTNSKESAAGSSESPRVHVASIKGRLLFDHILNNEVCYQVATQLNVGVWNTISSVLKSEKMYRPNEHILKETIRNPTLYYGNCGNIKIAPISNSVVSDFGLGADVINEFIEARNGALKELLKDVQDAVDKMKLGPYFAKADPKEVSSPDLIEAMRRKGVVLDGLATLKNTTSAKYDAAISDAASTVYVKIMEKSGERIRARIDKYGFMAAGSIERDLSKAAAITIALANQNPTVFAASLSSVYTAPVTAAQMAVSKTPSLSDESKGDGAFASTDGTDNASSFMAYWAPAMATMKAARESASGDPIGDMVTLGHTLLVLVEGIYLAVVASAGALAFADGAATAVLASPANLLSLGALGIPKALTSMGVAVGNWFGAQALALATPLLLVGIVQSFVLPMIPMMMVFIMGISWLILFLEAAIAAVLWAFAFVRMDGQEMFDKQQSPGISLLFNLFLRPAISMLAFIGALKLLPAVMGALSILWDSSFDNQTGDSMGIFGMTVIIQWIVGLVMFTWMQWHLALRIFGLIPTIADRVGHWMGVGASHGYNDGQETTQAVGAAVAAGSVAKYANARTNTMQEKRSAQQQQKAAEAKEKRDDEKHNQLVGLLSKK